MSETVDFFALTKEKSKENKATEEPKKEPKSNKPKTGAKTQGKEKKAAEKKETKYEYPFSLYTEGRTVDISNYGFEEGKKYTEPEITKIMLEHRHYEFAGDMTYKMFDDDNMLVATAKQFKKG